MLIRVDASPEIGAGHFMRMIALGQLLKDHGHEVNIATAAHPDTLPASSREFRLHPVPRDSAPGPEVDAAALTELARAVRADWVVLDGYSFTTEYERAVRSAGFKVLSVDDLGLRHFVSDVLLNQNYGAEATPCSTEPYTIRLLGTRHLLLRREFRVAQPRMDRQEPPRTALVTLGGGTAIATDALSRLAKALEQVDTPGLSFTVVAGMLGDVPAGVARLARAHPDRFDVLRHVDDMAAAMRAADFAITSGGSSVWELMAMRVPFLGVSLNAAQDAFLAALERDGLCVSLGPQDALRSSAADTIRAFAADAPLRKRLAGAAATVVDPSRSGEDILKIIADSQTPQPR